MAEEKSYTYGDVAEHTGKKDCWVVIHDKVYNATEFVDEHPGGEEVLLDVGGQDATEAFEDVGHSDEARQLLDGMLVGSLKRQPGDPKPKTSAPSKAPSRDAMGAGAGAGVGGIAMYVAIVVGGAAAWYGYQYISQKQSAA